MANGERQQASVNHMRNKQLEELLNACALKDQNAFARLYQLTSPNLYGAVLRILNREAWAQDCLQEAYVKIWNNAQRYRPSLAAPMTWMMAIVRNQALDLLRRSRREVMESDGRGFPAEADGGLLPAEALQGSEEGRRLKRCLDLLREQQRQVIALAYFKGLTHDELAQQTGTPLGTVKTWIRRGLEQLRRCLDP